MIEFTYTEIALGCIALIGWARAMYWKSKHDNLHQFNMAIIEDEDIRTKVLAEFQEWKANQT